MTRPAEMVAGDERMSSVDAAWLEMEDPACPMVMNGLLEFHGRFSHPRFVSRMAGLLMAEPRFRQCVQTHGAQRHWVAADQFDPGYHLPVHRLEARNFERKLRADVSREASTPLDLDRPLWRIISYPHPDGSLSMLVRIHHAVADGVALVRMLLRSVAGDVDGHSSARVADPPHHGPLAGLIEGAEWLNAGLERLGELLRQDLADPARLVQQLRDGSQFGMTLGGLLALPDNNPPQLHEPLAGRRSLAWRCDLSLAAFKRLAHRHQVTLNDVFLTLLARAFGSCLREGNVVLDPQQELRIAVPVNLRPDDDASLGNLFGLVLADLPIGLRDWEQQLAAVSQRMRELKSSRQPRVILLSLAAAGHLPPRIEKWLVNVLARKAGAVVSNLRGPDHPLALGRARLHRLAFWPPQTGGIGLGVSLFSYGRNLSVGVSADIGVLRDAQVLVDAFAREVNAIGS